MYPVSSKYQQALAFGFAFFATATHKDPFTLAETVLPIQAGSTVTVDVTQASRRALALTLPPLQSLFDIVTVPGGEITVSHTMVFTDRSTETVPLGVFVCETQNIGFAPGDSLTMTCYDRMRLVQKARMGTVRVSVPTNTVYQEIQRLLEGAWPNAEYPFPGYSNVDTSAAAQVGPLIWDSGDRWGVISGFATDYNLDVYFDANGLAVINQLPVLTDSSPTTWVAAVGSGGTLKAANRSRDLTKVNNVIVLTSSASDVQLPAVEVANTHVPSDDPLSSLGPLGRQVMDYSSSNFRTTDDMTAAGIVLLGKQLSVQQQLALTTTPNPAADGWDVIDVVLPAGDSGNRPAERHLVESLTIPLTPDGDQPITTRATRQTSDDSV